MRTTKSLEKGNITEYKQNAQVVDIKILNIDIHIQTERAC